MSDSGRCLRIFSFCNSAGGGAFEISAGAGSVVCASEAGSGGGGEATGVGRQAVMARGIIQNRRALVVEVRLVFIMFSVDFFRKNIVPFVPIRRNRRAAHNCNACSQRMAKTT